MIKIRNSNHLGAIYPFMTYEGGRNVYGNTISEITDNLNRKFEIDTLSVIEVLNKAYMLGDRTILKDVSRSPWMSHYDKHESSWVCHDLPKHGSIKMPLTEIADRLFNLLCAEILAYVKGKKKVGILLSGGMDSRIVAGVLHHLIVNQEVSVDKVIAYTWGDKDSRDVVYAKRITDLFQWDWKQYTVNADNLWENVIIAGNRGCEYSGLHLHAIPQISRDLEVDVMIAGSYGDSVGRAEYSGTRVVNLKSITAGFHNPSFILKNDIYKAEKDRWNGDIKKYHLMFPRDEAFQQYELDYQLHYMRRMLNACMELINEKVPFHQVFTEPAVFGFMWSLDPVLRTDKVYEYLLKNMHPELAQIPWARTGLKYPIKKGKPDQYKRRHHHYYSYIKEDLIDRIEERLLNHRAIYSHLINEHAVKTLLKIVKTTSKPNVNHLERLLWLTSLTYIYEKYDITSCFHNKSDNFDWFNGNVLLPIEHRYMQIKKLVKAMRSNKLRL